MSELKVHASACNDEPMVQQEDLRIAFAKRLKAALAHAGVAEWGAGRHLADITGRTPKAASKWINAESMPGRSNMLSIAAALSVRAEWLQYGDGGMLPDRDGDNQGQESNVIAADFSSKKVGMVDIPRLNVAGSMGNGLTRPEDYEDVIDRMRVSTGWLRRNVNATAPANLAVITGYGDSMEGTFSDGDLLLVDRGITEIKIDAVYVLSLKGELYIKRLQRRPDGVLLMLSDNEKYKPYEIKNGELEQFEVLGRVLLAWNAKRL